MIQPGDGTYQVTLKPYEYFGFVVITMEYGKNHSVAEMKEWIEASLPVATKAFNRVNRNRMNQLNVNETKDCANNMDIRRNTILRMETMANFIRERLHDEVYGKMLESRRLIEPGDFGKSHRNSYVRDVRVLYTVNMPDYDKSSPVDKAVAARWNQSLETARGYLPIGRQFVNKPIVGKPTKSGSRKYYTPFTLYGTVKQLD